MECVSLKLVVVLKNNLAVVSHGELQELISNLTETFDEFSKDDIPN